MKHELTGRKFRILDMEITTVLLMIGITYVIGVQELEQSGDEDTFMFPDGEYEKAILIPSELITMDMPQRVNNHEVRSRKVRLIPEGKDVTKRYYQNPGGQFKYRVVFSFGRVNHSSNIGRLAITHGAQGILPESLQPFMMATIYVNDTGYWLGEESDLPNTGEQKGIQYGVFSDYLREGEYLFVCGIYWHDNMHPMFTPKNINLAYRRTSLGEAKDIDMSIQHGGNYLIGTMSKSYKSYREMVGHWTCGTREIEIGGMHIVDATPDNIKPCTNKDSENTQKALQLQEGQPFQVNLDSAQTMASGVQYAFITWRFNISLWLIKTHYPICTGHTMNQVRSLYQWLISKNTRARHHLRNGKSRGKRDMVDTILGGVGAGMGIINQADISVLKTKLAAIASNSKNGFEVQREINQIISNLQQGHIDTSIGVATDVIQHFKMFVENMQADGRNISWALACTQGQVELSTNIKLAIQTLYNGQWPYELISQATAALPELLTFTHSKWWASAWIGCINHNLETCYASSLIPYTSSPLEVVYKVTSIGILTGGSTLLHPRLDHPHVIRKDGVWKQVDISLCLHRNQDILCTPGQDRLVEDKCWNNSSVCVLDGEFITKDKTPVTYLGHQRICFFLLNITNVTLITSQCSITTAVDKGAWCTLGNVTEIQTPSWRYVFPTIANLSIDIEYHNPVNLQALNLGMGKELHDWLIRFDQDEYLLRKLRQEGANATIVIHHDQKELKHITHLLENNAKGYWWEVIFGHSSAANGILNFLIHPIVVLLIVAVVLSLLQIYMCCMTRYLYKRLQALSMEIEIQTKYKIASCELDVPKSLEEHLLKCDNCGRQGHSRGKCLIPERYNRL
ncbi:uncharacterized protein LOC120995577 [Bufo bufo]|uniref:uncharacterized protein LOC120988598 n=1 Tax=Bufo bufo TaxID=8384 RepID=UPI001ABDC29A|nr:uncharacterized protein LOC120988598 [Bufo bufo]XP_040279152.1 uncharacterized protein LOC120994562 [Bufo bufo]XP_040280617.1 uncharacterized protein LOC120995455 [Bufo bufo]XP_040280788.1 uncharacterized protein LOC120995577 [Bufo bufo]